MHALFVHGMWRTPLSGWPMLWRLRRGGLQTSTFGYMSSLEDFLVIRGRLVQKIAALATSDYVLIGHSLGGVLIRAAVNALPPETRTPHHVFLLGSPVRPSRLAQKLGRNPIYRGLTRDCGELLGSAQRMSGIGRTSVPTTAIVGIRGLPWQRGPFGGELNDGVVSISEVSAVWFSEQIEVSTVHTLLPASKSISNLILERVISSRRAG